MFTLTVFTPTFNRGSHLKRLYAHLCSQTNKDFVWVIIDDGSTDETRDIIASFIDENTISIKYYYQNNMGKHIAYNKALDVCDTKLFICVDSDDFLLDNAVETIISNYLSMKEKRLLGFYYKQISTDGKPVTEAFPNNLLYVGITDLFHSYSFHSETAIVLVVEMISHVRFPYFDNEKFVTERVFYNSINNIAPMAICNESIYVSEYLDDGYTKNASIIRIRNPKGTALDFYLEACYGKRIIYRLKCCSQYLAFLYLFDIDKFDYNDKIPKSIIRLSYFFVPHYYTLYKKLVKKYGT